ncbi:sialate O-acetylesterase [Bacteroidia bacterium]|nr:sialate O-acetylesterase [Bacteroidia bacterium]
MVVSLHYDIPQKGIKKVAIIFQKNNIENNISPKEYSGYIYAKETIESLVYRRSGFNIIMLGDSHTCHNNWGELLNRDDIANFGIGGDGTESIIKRINDVSLVSPSKCFLMIGINDIFGGKSLDEIEKNYETIIKYLKKDNIEIIIQSVLCVSELSERLGHDWKKINKKVFDLNSRLEKLAIGYDIKYVDINQLLLENNNLNNSYTSGDGVHLNKDGYERWCNEIKKHL